MNNDDMYYVGEWRVSNPPTTKGSSDMKIATHI